MSDKTLPQPPAEQQAWLFTFGSGQEYDGRFVVVPGSYADARDVVLRRFGNAWSFQYPAEDRQAMEERYGMVELPRAEWPEPAADPKPAYVPGSPAELAGYLGSVVEHAAQQHPDDEGLARGVAVWQAWRAAQGWDTPAGGEDGAQ